MAPQARLAAAVLLLAVAALLPRAAQAYEFDMASGAGRAGAAAGRRRAVHLRQRGCSHIWLICHISRSPAWSHACMLQ